MKLVNNSMKLMKSLLENRRVQMLLAAAVVCVVAYHTVPQVKSLLDKGEDKVEEVASSVKSAATSVTSAVSKAVPKVSLCKGKKMPEKKEKKAASKKDEVTGFDGAWGEASPLDSKQ